MRMFFCLGVSVQYSHGVFEWVWPFRNNAHVPCGCLWAEPNNKVEFNERWDP